MVVVLINNDCVTGDHSSTKCLCKKFGYEHLIWSAIGEHTTRKQENAISPTSLAQMVRRKQSRSPSGCVTFDDVKNDLLAW
jgi:hypothetical protein